MIFSIDTYIMAFTRFHDDPARIRKGLEQSTYAEGYYLNTPGMGIHMPLQTDPQLRLQAWGANLCSNAIELESDFRGLTRKLNHDLVEENEYKKHKAHTDSYLYDSANPIVDESRATHPAWMYRDAEQTRWEYPWINPQDNFERVFPWNVQTRILEKDFYTPKMPKVLGVERTDFYFPR
jgi:hypothetical protein